MEAEQRTASGCIFIQFRTRVRAGAVSGATMTPLSAGWKRAAHGPKIGASTGVGRSGDRDAFLDGE
jgi:hypothetical protein